MSTIGRLWAGKVFGTNTGNLSVEINNKDDALDGLLRFMDDRFGLVVYKIAGTFDGSRLALIGEAEQAPEGIATGTITATATLSPDGNLNGEWSSSLGTGGTFVLFPHDRPDVRGTSGSSALPEQLHTAIRPIGALRLYADDVRELIGFLRRDFGIGRVVVTYHERGNEISKYATDFENDIERLGDLRYLKLTVQEPEVYGINRVATVEMNANGGNEVRAQGVQESWVVGKAEAVASQLRLRQKTLATTFRKFGLNINGLLAVGTLVVLPELSVARRIAFVVVMILVAAAIVYLHDRYIPNALIHLGRSRAGVFRRAWPQALSWFIAVSATIVASVAYGLLKGDLPALAAWLSDWLR